MDDITFWEFVIVGFLAQLIDGSLGMAYGVSSSSFLLSLGVSPVISSASVHLAEVFTTFVSGLSHWQLGNVEKKLVGQLAIPGVIGGVSGAFLLSNLSGSAIKPFISAFLLLMGVRILFKACQKEQLHSGMQRGKTVLGLVGGFFDALGGGGWGPIVTTSLLVNGEKPRKAIGSVNLAEFFVTFAESITFTALIGVGNWNVVLGLVSGGILAAPLGALLVRKLPVRALLGTVGLTIIFLCARTIWLAVM